MTKEEYGETESLRGEIEFDIECPYCDYNHHIDIDKVEWNEAGDEKTSDEIECKRCEALFPVEYDIESYMESYPIGFRVGRYIE